MKRYIFLIAVLAAVLSSCSEKKNVITVNTPERPAGQESILGLRTEPLETVRIGVVGLGMRGGSAVDRLTFVPDCSITAICDIEQERVDRSAARLEAKGIAEVLTFGGEAESWEEL